MIDSNNNDTEVPEDQPEKQALQLNVKDFVCWSQAKAEPQKRVPADYSLNIIPLKKGIIFKSNLSFLGNYSLSAYDVSKKVIHLLRHSQREDDGAVQLWRIEEQLHAWQQEAERKGDISTALMFQEQLFISELFKDTQDAISVNPSLQDNVVIQRGFFFHIYHIGCAFNLHSIINNGLIPGSQNSSKRQTVFFLPIHPRDKGHQDPAQIDFTLPRRAQYLHSAWKKHQDAVFWFILILQFIDCSHPSRNTSSLLYPKSCDIEDWRSFAWESIHVNSWKNWGKHGLQHSRNTTFCSETVAWRQRSRIDSENRVQSESTCSSTRRTAKSIMQSLQSRIKKPKPSAKYVYHDGTSASSTRNSSRTRWTSIPDYHMKKGDLTGTVMGRSKETKYTTSPISSRSCAKRCTIRVSTNDLYEMTNTAGIWLK